jgi:hypothetical protein
MTSIAGGLNDGEDDIKDEEISYVDKTEEG